MNDTPLSRRRLLQGTGVTLALPLFESLSPFRARGANAAPGIAPDYNPDGTPRRMICICNNLSLHRPFYEPTETGRDYAPSRYLKLID